MLKEKMKRYQTLINEIDNMVVRKEQGLDVARKLNDEFWNDLGAHQKRMKEQYNKLVPGLPDKELQTELNNADSIYEATRTYISKYK